MRLVLRRIGYREVSEEKYRVYRQKKSSQRQRRSYRGRQGITVLNDLSGKITCFKDISIASVVGQCQTGDKNICQVIFQGLLSSILYGTAKNDTSSMQQNHCTSYTSITEGIKLICCVEKDEEIMGTKYTKDSLYSRFRHVSEVWLPVHQLKQNIRDYPPSTR